MATATDVSVVIVSYNTRDLLRECLRSVYASSVTPREVFVVDNASSDGSQAMVAAEFPAVTLDALDRNLGFAGANNVAIRRSTGSRLLLLNPDAVLAPDALALLVAALDSRPRAASVGPRILNPDGSLQSCGYGFPGALSELRQSKRVDRVLTWAIGPTPVPSTPTTTAEVDWSDGACMLLRREAVSSIGGLDEQYFLYTEELDWCFNARKSGWTVVVVPEAVVWHHRGQSSANTGGGSLATSLLVETKLRYYRKNHSLGTAAGMAVLMAVGHLKQWRVDPSARAKLAGVGRWIRPSTRRKTTTLAPTPPLRVG